MIIETYFSYSRRGNGELRVRGRRDASLVVYPVPAPQQQPIRAKSAALFTGIKLTTVPECV